jgi:hypothetical protein
MTTEHKYLIAGAILLPLWITSVAMYYLIEMKARRNYAARKAVSVAELHKSGHCQEGEQKYMSVADFIAYRPDGTLGSSRQWAGAATAALYAFLVFCVLLAALDSGEARKPYDSSATMIRKALRGAR